MDPIRNTFLLESTPYATTFLSCDYLFISIQFGTFAFIPRSIRFKKRHCLAGDNVQQKCPICFNKTIIFFKKLVVGSEQPRSQALSSCQRRLDSCHVKISTNEIALFFHRVCDYFWPSNLHWTQKHNLVPRAFCFWSAKMALASAGHMTSKSPAFGVFNYDNLCV